MKPAILALAIALTPFAANAGEITLNKPLQGATLPGTETDMAVYFTKSRDAGYRVHAAYIGKDAEGQPKRVEMELHDGDAVSFSLPGHKGESYCFSRNGDTLSVSNELVTAELPGKAS